MVAYGPFPDRVTKLTMIAVFEKVEKYNEAALFRKELGMSPVILREIKDKNTKENQKINEVHSAIEKIDKKDDIYSIDLIKKDAISGKNNKIKLKINQKKEQIIKKSEKTRISVDISETEPFSSGIRLSPAGTLREKLMENGRRRVKIYKEELRQENEGGGERGEKKEEGEEEEGGDEGRTEYVNSDGVSMNINISQQGLRNVKGKKVSIVSTSERTGLNDVSTSSGVAGNEIKSKNGNRYGDNDYVRLSSKWEKGGGGAASVITLLGLSGKNQLNRKIYYFTYDSNSFHFSFFFFLLFSFSAF